MQINFILIGQVEASLRLKLSDAKERLGKHCAIMNGGFSRWVLYHRHENQRQLLNAQVHRLGMHRDLCPSLCL
jgi:hypothetical protein